MSSAGGPLASESGLFALQCPAAGRTCAGAGGATRHPGRGLKREVVMFQTKRGWRAVRSILGAAGLAASAAAPGLADVDVSRRILAMTGDPAPGFPAGWHYSSLDGFYGDNHPAIGGDGLIGFSAT